MSGYSSAADRDSTCQSAADRHDEGRSASDLDLLSTLQTWFAVEFQLFDGETGELLRDTSERTVVDVETLGPLCRVVAERGRAELVDDEEPLLVLAVPLEHDVRSRVAVGTFVSAAPMTVEQIKRTAQRMELSPEDAARWIGRQARWTPRSLLAMGQLGAERYAATREVASLRQEVRDISLQLSTSYEEISLLYRLTQNLRLSRDVAELGQLALEWLSDVVPAESLALQLAPRPVDGAADSEPVFHTYGRCPVDSAALSAIVEHFAARPGGNPLIVNPPVTQAANWQWPGVREMVVVSLTEGDNGFGWLAAFNHSEGAQFGSVEGSLLSSVGVILGIHCGNAELYEQQREFFAGVVRALTSAIDAKDPYTCGHSDRVARISKRLAEEMGCTKEQLDTIYLSGLLHDVGKIGVDDTVLRKPGKLTDTEYEHIKTHVEIGFRILVDIKQLDEVLPAVLHHHEQWNGRGYPHGLVADKIPLLARIVAVADAFDAMSSSRPYREGMSDEKLDAILRDGAGKQWDPDVVEAFFRARDDIRKIAHDPVARVTLDFRK